MTAENDPDDTLAEGCDEFGFSLTFVGEECPSCGTLGEPGSCPGCGGQIPASAKTSEEVDARIAALGRLATRAQDLVRDFDAIRRPFIPVSLGQFATALTDADLYNRAGAMTDVGHVLGGLDLNDKSTIGGALRRKLSERLDHTQDLLCVCQELGAMLPEAPAQEARDLAIAGGRYGASLLATLLRLLTSRTIREAREREAEMNQLLEGFSPGKRMMALLEDVGYLATLDDIDDRISRVLERPGSYTDELGMLSLPLVFGAFSDQEQPMLRLAERAREYFAHMLPAELPEPAHAVLLAVPAVTVGALDRPLVAHRCAQLMAELCAQAFEASPDQVNRLVERTSEQGALIFAAATRIDRAIRLLAVGDLAGAVDDIAVVDTLMKAYLELSEASLRTMGWLALDLQETAAGNPVPVDSRSPMLGELEQQLASSSSRLCHEFSNATDSGLRNAAAHAQYTWDPAAKEVCDLRTGERWAVDDLDRRMHALVGALAGSDAGYACFLVGNAIDLPLPRWAQGAGQSFLARLVAEAAFGAYGSRVDDVSAAGDRLILAPGAAIDPLRLLPPLAGFAAVHPHTSTFRIYRRGERDPVAEVSAESLAVARSAPGHLQDISILHAVLDVALVRRSDPAVVVAETLAVLAKVVAFTAVQQLATGPHGQGVFVHIAARMAYARRFARERGIEGEPVTRDAASRFQRAQEAASAARTGQPAALRRLLSALQSLFDWGESRGARWPPI